MKYSLILHKENNQYGMETLTDNPFDRIIPDIELSIFMDWLNMEKAKNKTIIDKNFYDAEYFAENGVSAKSGLVNYEEFSKTFASEHADRVEVMTGGDKSKRILEIGCAFGWTVDELRKRGYDAYGCDISEWIVNRYKRDYIFQHDIESSEIKNGSIDKVYDVIYSFATFEHFHRENIRIVFDKIDFMLKNNGILFATIDNLWGGDQSHNTLMPREWWNKIASEHGFKVDEKLTEQFKAINGYVWGIK